MPSFGRILSTKLIVPETQWMCSPACTELENITMDWAAKLFGLSEDFYNTTNVGGGVIQVGRVTWLFRVPGG